MTANYREQPDDADPFECPRCGAHRVRVSGNGAKDCQACPWEYRPEPEDTSEQVGLDGF